MILFSGRVILYSSPPKLSRAKIKYCVSIGHTSTVMPEDGICFKWQKKCRVKLKLCLIFVII